jgi:hypothetical protein
MAEGTLIAESLRVGAEVEGPALTVHMIMRVEPGTVSEEQAAGGVPPRRTLLEFEVADEQAAPLARALAGALDPVGWYVDFHTGAETFVVFSERVFRYPRGDASGREQARAHGRSVGVPEAQLDWPE